MSLKLTPAAKELICEALQMLQATYQAQAEHALDGGDKEAFHNLATKALNAKFVQRQVNGGKS